MHAMRPKNNSINQTFLLLEQVRECYENLTARLHEHRGIGLRFMFPLFCSKIIKDDITITDALCSHKS